MVQKYNGHYHYNNATIENWNSSSIGVYYCGYPLANGNLSVLYVGRATGNDGIRGRLLQHLREDYFEGATHFGYCICSTITEAENLEAVEIKRLQPRFNKIGK